VLVAVVRQTPHNGSLFPNGGIDLNETATQTLTDESAGFGEERLAVIGSGAIACGLAAAAARLGEVTLVARSDRSARLARGKLDKVCARLGDDPLSERVTIEHDYDAIEGATFVVETVLEDVKVKRQVLRTIGETADPDAILATTTSSLSIRDLAEASGDPSRFVGFHPFNPVPRMKLLEIAFPPEATELTRVRARRFGERLGKTVVEVPDRPGFVVNALLFPYLFGAVELLERTGMEPSDVDTCMTLGAGHPMGPLALLDFVGLDVAQAIGGAIDLTVPSRIDELVAEGALGKKTGRGFYVYGP
jgi:3-hydroxybutyryl-CoA dehydrogenase